MHKIADKVAYINIGILAVPENLDVKIKNALIYEKSLADLIRNALEEYLEA